jgi:hypothetical protein
MARGRRAWFLEAFAAIVIFTALVVLAAIFLPVFVVGVLITASWETVKGWANG